MSNPVWNGGKDKNAFRIMSDKVGGTSGVRTVVQTQGDTTTTLRTRAGNPEVTIEKRGASLEFVEVGYKQRKYLAERSDFPTSSAVKTTSGHGLPLHLMSTIAFRLRSMTLNLLGKLTFKVPPPTESVFDGTWVDDSNRTWRDSAFEHANFHKPVLHTSSDGVFTFVAHSPKSAACSAGALRFKAVEKLAGNTPLTELSNAGEGFAKRTFYDPIVMRPRAANGLASHHFAYVIAPVKTVQTSGVGKLLSFSKPKPDDSDDPLYDADYLPNGFGDPYGRTVLKFNPFDHVIVFGQPWHGCIDMQQEVFVTDGESPYSGVISRFRGGNQSFSDMRPGSLFGNYIDRSGFVQLVRFDDLPDLPTTMSAFGVVTGASFNNYAMLCGERRQYSPATNGFGAGQLEDEDNPFLLNNEPRDSGCFGENTWLYRTAEGVVWCLWLRYLWVSVDQSKLEIWGRRVADRYGDFELIATENPPNDSGRVDLTDYNYLMSTPNGSKAAVATLGVDPFPKSGVAEIGKLISVSDGSGYFDKPVLAFESLTFPYAHTVGGDGYIGTTEKIGEYDSVNPVAFWLRDSGSVAMVKVRSRAYGLATTPSPNAGEGWMNWVTAMSWETTVMVDDVIIKSVAWSYSAQFVPSPQATIPPSFLYTGPEFTKMELGAWPKAALGLSSSFNVQQSDRSGFGGTPTVTYAKRHSVLHSKTIDIGYYQRPSNETYFTVDDPMSGDFLVDKWPW